jgi:hypothetical protein
MRVDGNDLFRGVRGIDEEINIAFTRCQITCSVFIGPAIMMLLSLGKSIGVYSSVNYTSSSFHVIFNHPRNECRKSNFENLVLLYMKLKKGLLCNSKLFLLTILKFCNAHVIKTT